MTIAVTQAVLPARGAVVPVGFMWPLTLKYYRFFRGPVVSLRPSVVPAKSSSTTKVGQAILLVHLPLGSTA
jgi:hypothetical protein